MTILSTFFSTLDRNEQCKFVPLKGKIPIRKGWEIDGVEVRDIKELLVADMADSIGLVCGTKYNIECIDIDEQHYLGISEKVLPRFMDDFEDILHKFYIERTPSNGVHIIYRTPKVLGNRQIAARLNEEGKKETFIETRGQRGQVRIAPSAGCEIIYPKNIDHFVVPDEELTDEEYEELNIFMLSFNELAKEVKKPTVVRNFIKKYGKSPFDEFNEKVDMIELLISHGWTYSHTRGHMSYMTRPGKSTRDGISATVFGDTNRAYIFSTSTEFDSESVYSPSDIECKLKYGGDFKAMYEDIKDEYGTFLPHVSRKLADKFISNSLLRIDEVDLSLIPKNLTDLDKQRVVDEINVSKEKWEFGTFWVKNDDEKIEIDRVRLYETMHHLGFRMYNQTTVRIVENPYLPSVGKRFIIEVKKTYVNRVLKSYTREREDGGSTEIRNAIDKFFEAHQKHILENLVEIKRGEFATDDENQFVRYFKNGEVLINADGIYFSQYAESDKLIPLSKYIHRDFNARFVPKLNGAFMTYLEKAVLDVDYALRCCAYLLHDHKGSHNTYLIGLIEQCVDERRAGGSGKNLLTSLLGQLISVKNISADGLKMDTTTLQAWTPDDRVVSFDDAPKDFNYMALREMVSGSAVVKHLWVNQTTYTKEELPKFMFSTNHGVPVLHGSLRRRMRLIEFTDFFNQSGGVANYFYNIAKATNPRALPVDFIFPDNSPFTLNQDFSEKPQRRNFWNDYDWDEYFYVMFKAVADYMKSGQTIGEENLSDEGWIKQFQYVFGENVWNYLEEQIPEYINDEDKGRMLNDKFYKDYTDWCIRNSIRGTFQVSNQKLVKAVREYCSAKGYEFIEGVSMLYGSKGKIIRRKKVDNMEKPPF